MALTILAGTLAGFAGFLPLWAALRLTQQSPSIGMGVTAVESLGGVAISLIVLAAAMIIAARIAHCPMGVFGFTELITFVFFSVVYFLWRNKVLRRSAQGATNGKGE